MGAYWTCDDGDDIHATIETDYDLKHNVELSKPHWRHINFDTLLEDGIYHQVSRTPFEQKNCWLSFARQSEKLTVVDRLYFGDPAPLRDIGDTISNRAGPHQEQPSEIAVA